MTGTLDWTTRSPEETEALGAALAGLLPLGALVALRGELASGKTCFIRGMARRFTRGEAVHSPTFTLVNEYGAGPKLYHLDLYRLTAEEVADLGYEELFEPEDAVTVVEWAERAELLLPPRRLDVHFAHAGGDTRALRFHDRGLLPPGWQDALKV